MGIIVFHYYLQPTSSEYQRHTTHQRTKAESNISRVFATEVRASMIPINAVIGCYNSSNTAPLNTIGKELEL